MINFTKNSLVNEAHNVSERD